MTNKLKLLMIDNSHLSISIPELVPIVCSVNWASVGSSTGLFAV